MYGEILRALLDMPVKNKRDARIFALRITVICFFCALAADTALQLLAFGTWFDVYRGWAITTGVIVLVAYPVALYLGRAHLDHYNSKAKLIEQNLADSLTGLKSRGSLLIDYDAMSDNSRLVILLSLDRFKAVNERYGHIVGDRILIRAARLIAEEVGNLGAIYRTDGVEFTILATGCSVADARSQVLALLARLESTNLGTLEKPVCLTASAGIAEAPTSTPFSLAFAAADLALEAAKVDGRSRVSLASEPVAAGIVEGNEVVWSANLPPPPRRRRSERS